MKLPNSEPPGFMPDAGETTEMQSELDRLQRAIAQLLDRVEHGPDKSATRDQADALCLQLIALGRAADRPDAVLAGLASRAELHPTDPQINNDYGRHLSAAGDFRRALPHLRLSAPVLKHHDESLWSYTTALAHLGEYRELLSVQPLLDQLADTVPPPYGPYRHLAVAKLSLHVDRERVLNQIAELERSPDWLNVDELVAALAHAINERKPFSFVRMFDGEARFLSYLSPNVHKILRPQELSAMINSIWQSWFKEVIEAFDPVEVSKLGQTVLEAACHADILGIAGFELAGGDYYHFGFLAEMQAMLLATGTRRYTGALVHHELHRTIPFLKPLIENLPFLGFVGCHPELAFRLARTFNIAQHASYIVPGENGRIQLPANVLGTGHFPHIYARILSDLSVPFEGAVFLVGAGLLGKVYCARIKELGGIAIDIGALADGWMGYNTRPGQFDQIDEWRLED